MVFSIFLSNKIATKWKENELLAKGSGSAKDKNTNKSMGSLAVKTFKSRTTDNH